MLGAMSAAAPGGQFARRTLMEPLNNRVWFAGEAVHERLWGTVGGAWESGERAALAALQVIAPSPGSRSSPSRNSSRNPAASGMRSSCEPKALIAWSSGKDSAWALHETRRGGEFEIVGALTTVTETFGRVSMHGVREDLLAAQLDAAELAPIRVPIPYPCPNEIYEARMAAALADAKAAGVTHVIFGDLFLEDVRRYREDKLAGTGIAPVFPLWGRPTAALAREMIDGGVETYLACVDLKQLPIAFAGRRLDHALLADLPASADPCGEKGEFHTFVAAGPMLSRRIPVSGWRRGRARGICVRGFAAGADGLAGSCIDDDRLRLQQFQLGVGSDGNRVDIETRGRVVRIRHDR